MQFQDAVVVVAAEAKAHILDNSFSFANARGFVMMCCALPSGCDLCVYFCK